MKGGLLSGAVAASSNSTDVASPLVMQVYQEVEGSVALERLQELDKNGTLAQIPRKAGGELSSVGSILHAEAKCSPCAYWFKGICKYSIGCTYCHYVHEGQKSKRLRASKQTRMRIKRRAEAQEMQSLASLESPMESEFIDEDPDVDATTTLMQGGLSTHGTTWLTHGTAAMDTGLVAHQSAGSMLHAPHLPADTQPGMMQPTALHQPQDTQRFQQDQWRQQQQQHLAGQHLSSARHQSGSRLEGQVGLLADFGSPATPATLSYADPLRANAADGSLAPPPLSNSPAYVHPSFAHSLPGMEGGSADWDVPATSQEYDWIHRLR